MLRDRVKEYYLEKDYNCAETTLHCINDEYGLGLTDEQIKLASGFGAGMGCGQTCGVLCAGIAALGKLLVDQRAHNTEGFGDICAAYVGAFQAKLGSLACEELVKTYKKEETRCLETVLLAADLFEDYFARLPEGRP